MRNHTAPLLLTLGLAFGVGVAPIQAQSSSRYRPAPSDEATLRTTWGTYRNRLARAHEAGVRSRDDEIRSYQQSVRDLRLQVQRLEDEQVFLARMYRVDHDELIRLRALPTCGGVQASAPLAEGSQGPDTADLVRYDGPNSLYGVESEGGSGASDAGLFGQIKDSVRTAITELKAQAERQAESAAATEASTAAVPAEASGPLLSMPIRQPGPIAPPNPITPSAPSAPTTVSAATTHPDLPERIGDAVGGAVTGHLRSGTEVARATGGAARDIVVAQAENATGTLGAVDRAGGHVLTGGAAALRDLTTPNTLSGHVVRTASTLGQAQVQAGGELVGQARRNLKNNAQTLYQSGARLGSAVLRHPANPANWFR